MEAMEKRLVLVSAVSQFTGSSSSFDDVFA